MASGARDLGVSALVAKSVKAERTADLGGVRMTRSNLLTANTTLLAQDAGNLFSVAAASAATIKLPKVADSIGATFFFTLVSGGAANVTITSVDTGLSIGSFLLGNTRTTASTLTSFTFVNGTATAGDFLTFRAVKTASGGIWHVSGQGTTTGAITTA